MLSETLHKHSAVGDHHETTIGVIEDYPRSPYRAMQQSSRSPLMRDSKSRWAAHSAKASLAFAGSNEKYALIHHRWRQIARL
jgi:hypothetical protein